MIDNRKQKITFFTFNNFSKDGGGTIRMRGIVNALAAEGVQVVLVSNMMTAENFHPNVNHIYLDYFITKRQKRLFQLLLSFLPVFMVKIIFSNMITVVNRALSQHNIDRESIVFF